MKGEGASTADEEIDDCPAAQLVVHSVVNYVCGPATDEECDEDDDRGDEEADPGYGLGPRGLPQEEQAAAGQHQVAHSCLIHKSD